MEPARTDVTIDEPLAQSTLPALGVSEAITGAASAERAVRAVTTEVGACVKPAVEREPELRGTMIFRIEPGASVPIKPAGGTLSALPAAGCVRDALAGVKSEAAIDYTLTFAGNPNPKPVRPGAVLSEDWVSVDWSSSGPEAPPAFAESRAALGDRLLRCAFAAEPILNEKVWLAARVAKGGAVTVGAGKPGDASDCIWRAVRATTFPDAGRDYAFSVVLRPSGDFKPAEADDEQQEFGMIGLLNSGDSSAPWGRDDATGGLGLRGTGKGGGGTGIGIGTIGSGNTTGQGFGNGNGRLGGAHSGKPPSVRMGATSVSGRLPPEVIRRIVRQNYGRFRLCYENGLRKDPTLSGKISVSFEITREGDTAKISAASEMKDKSVVACVQKAFAGLSFPQPDGGVVKVTYPIMFAPGDAPAGTGGQAAGGTPAAPPPALSPQTIDGKPIASVSMVDVEKRLVAKGFEVSRVPGSGDVPALFVNDESNRLLYTLTLEPEREGMRGPLCKAGNKDRQLYVRGDRCERVMEPLLD